MAKANAILLNSILWNLREITKLTEKIKSHCGDVNCTSWRYPLAICSELEIFKLLQNNKNLDNYTYILELTYDRLLYVFNLMVKYLESTDSSEKFRPKKNVTRPKTLSLASVLYMIWDRIKDQNINSKSEEKLEMLKSNSFAEIKVCKISSYTQTEVCSISICSSCEMAQMFISELVIKMEESFDKKECISAITNERKMCKKFLLERTTWSAMSRWVNAIMEDFITIFSTIQQETVKNENVRYELDREEIKIKSKIEQYKEEQKKLESCLYKYKTKCSEMKHKICQLNKEKKFMSQVIIAKNTQIVLSKLKFKNKLANLKNTHENKLSNKKNSKTKKKNENKLRYEKKTECKLQKRRDLEAVNAKLLETIQKYSKDLENLNAQTNKDRNSLLNQYSDLSNKMDNLKEENLNLNILLKEKEKLLEEYCLKIMEAFPELHNVSKFTYKASGNPQIDMKNQIESNKLRISLLVSENEKLRKTLNKIAAMKS